MWDKRWLYSLRRLLYRWEICLLFFVAISPHLIFYLRSFILDPNCKNAEYRSEEIANWRYDLPAFRRDIEAFKDQIFGIAKQLSTSSSNGGTLEVYTYQDLICVPMYIVLRGGQPYKGYSSFFLAKPTGTNFVHLEWTERDGGVLEEMKSYFDQKWQAQSQNASPYFSSRRVRV